MGALTSLTRTFVPSKTNRLACTVYCMLFRDETVTSTPVLVAIGDHAPPLLQVSGEESIGNAYRASVATLKNLSFAQVSDRKA